MGKAQKLVGKAQKIRGEARFGVLGLASAQNPKTGLAHEFFCLADKFLCLAHDFHSGFKLLYDSEGLGFRV